MNLIKLFDTQRILDARIEKEHPRAGGEDRLAKKILALQVELGELANELPEVFKFWSNKKNNYEKALKEYVDSLHFILSIGLVLKFDTITPYLVEVKKPIEMFSTVYFEVTCLSTKGGRSHKEYHYGELVAKFFSLGKSLGFSWEQILQAYYDKNAINHERQDTGY